jgi:putative multiple sugar transport system substrate-binding protein
MRIAATAGILALTVTLAACGSSVKTAEQSPQPGASAGGLVGVTMPTKSSERWIHDGDNIKAQLEKLGYQVDLQYAENDIPTQVNQIENQITKGAKLLVIASIDGTAITTQLQEAADKKIPVIAYDRLIRNSPNVDYYATFDNFKVGVQQATSLLTGLKLKKADGSDDPSVTGPFNIELFAGSPDDNNATFFFNGAMSVLKPYLDKGTLKVASGQTEFTTVAILRWEPATAQRRMEDLLTKSIIAGEQYATIFKDTRDLAKSTVDMADAVLKGGKPQVNNTKDYNNGVKVVPSQLLQPVIVDKTNYQKVLVDSGYYTAGQLK